MEKIMCVFISILLIIGLCIGIIIVLDNQYSNKNINNTASAEDKIIANVIQDNNKSSIEDEKTTNILLTNINDEVEANKLKNVKLEIDKNTLSNRGARLIITDTNEPDLGWGEDYSIQIKTEEGWTNLKPTGDVFFSLIHYILDENNQTTQQLNWYDYYGELENGEYRIVKPLANNSSIYSDKFVIE